MSRIQFDRRKRKKGYLIPLIIIVLLYFTIPVFLINKGNDLITKSDSKMKNSTVFSPPIEFYNGIAFLNTASAFPGFGGWSGAVEEESIKKMISQQEIQFKKLSLDILNIESSDSVKLSFNKKIQPVTIELNSYDSIENKSYQLNDSILSHIESIYCKPWIKFFEKTKTDMSLLYSFCEN